MKIERVGLVGGSLKRSKLPEIQQFPEKHTNGFMAINNSRLMFGRQESWDLLAMLRRFTSSGRIHCPDDVFVVFVAAGGGGGGGVRYNSSGSANWVAGAGGGLSYAEIDVQPGDVIQVTVGSGGRPNPSNRLIGSPGGPSFVVHNSQEYARAEGGGRGNNSTNIPKGGEGNTANGSDAVARYTPGPGAEALLSVLGRVKAGDGGLSNANGESGIVVIGY